MRIRLLLAVTLLAPLLPNDVSAQARRAPMLEDYYRVASVGSPVISPDGGRVAYIRTRVLEEANRRHGEMWLVDVSAAGEPRRLTGDSFDASGPRWSPDGRTLVFSATWRSDTGDSTGRGVWFLDVDGGGDPHQVDGIDRMPIFDAGGRTIAFTAPDRPDPPAAKLYASEFERRIDERFDGKKYDWMGVRFDRRGYLDDPRDPVATPPREVFVRSAGTAGTAGRGGDLRQVTFLGVDAQGVAWRPDGGALAFTADAHQRDEHTYERADVWFASLDGKTTRLTDDEYHYSNPAWGPDGAFVVVQGREGLDRIIDEGRSRGAPTDLYVIETNGGAPRNITGAWDLIPGAPLVSPDGRWAYFMAGIGGDRHLFRASVSGGVVEQVTDGSRRLGGFSFTGDMSAMAFVSAGPSNPGDIHVASIDGRDERRVAEGNGQWLAEVELVDAEAVRFPSADGTEIEGWLMLPHGYDPTGGPYPLILAIHGGPHGAYGTDFSLHRQLLAAQGYMVLFTNPRGSTGYGEDFRWATWGGWGVLDYEDIMAGVDYVVDRYPVDQTHMGVTGGSYGGFMTNWVIGHTQRFAAAVARASISNWVSDYGVADIPRTKESEFFGPPWEEASRELMMRLSPITYAGNVTTPTLFLHGELDHRVPIEEAEQMYTALQKQRVPAAFVRYPESYHGGWTPWRQVHAYYYELEWWKKYLKERPEAE